MNICFFAQYNHTNSGGATLSLYGLANELARRGFNIFLVQPNVSNDVPAAYRHPNIQTVKIKHYSMRIPLASDQIAVTIKAAIKYSYNLYAVARLYLHLKNKRIHLIHVNGLDSPVGALTAKLLRVPYVWHIRQFLDEDLKLALFRETESTRLLSSANAVVAISKSVQLRYANRLQRKVCLIYNGISMDSYRLPFRDKFKGSIINIILAGRVHEYKGQIEAIKAIGYLFEHYSLNAHLFIVGHVQDNQYYLLLKKHIADNQLNDRITFWEHTDDLRPLRLKCDIGLTCSKMEAFGRITVENMVAGLLAIGADTGGTPEIITHNQTGLLYEQGNYKDLADKIAYAASLASDVNRIIRDGYDSATNRFSVTRVADETIGVYQEVLASQSSNNESGPSVSGIIA